MIVSLFSGFKWNISGLSLLLRKEFINLAAPIKKFVALTALFHSQIKLFQQYQNIIKFYLLDSFVLDLGLL